LFLWDTRYRCYWFETGTPTFLLDLIKLRKFYLPTLEEIKVTDSQLGAFDINNIQLEVLLFQAGYLTVEKCVEIDENYYYYLKIPNKEVRKGLNDYLMNTFYTAAVDITERTALSEKIYIALTENKPDDLKVAFFSLFAGIPYEWYTKNKISEFEGFYCSVFYACFASLGLNIKVEDATNKGRIDFTLILSNAIFVFEIKMKKTNKNALEQINDRKYYEKYLTENKDIYLIGIVFDESERNISDFRWEKVYISIA